MHLPTTSKLEHVSSRQIRIHLWRMRLLMSTSVAASLDPSPTTQARVGNRHTNRTIHASLSSIRSSCSSIPILGTRLLTIQRYFKT